MKRIFAVIFSFIFVFAITTPIKAADSEATIYFFWAKGCGHCAQAKEFLSQLEEKYPQIEIQQFEVTSNPQYAKILDEAVKRLGNEAPLLPVTIVGENLVSGYLSDEITGTRIEKAVNCALTTHCEDIVASLTSNAENAENKDQGNRNIPERLKVPIIGDVYIKNLSLPVLTIIIGGLDGFNPCAMWTLLFLVSLLLGMSDRKRMWVLGSAFIVTSATVYFMFMTAWLNLFLFLGFVLWIRVLISIVALGAGGYNLRDFFVNKEGKCKITGDEKRKATFEKLREITQRRNFIMAVAGIILLAIAVNMVELVCSAGFPAIYTQILSLSPLPRAQHYLYLLLYIFVFMLDDMVVFVIAMVTLKAVGMQGKYARYSRLIGGSLMLVVGLLLLFKPEWLMFA